MRVFLRAVVCGVPGLPRVPHAPTPRRFRRWTCSRPGFPAVSTRRRSRRCRVTSLKPSSTAAAGSRSASTTSTIPAGATTSRCRPSLRSWIGCSHAAVAGTVVRTVQQALGSSPQPPPAPGPTAPVTPIPPPSNPAPVPALPPASGSGGGRRPGAGPDLVLTLSSGTSTAVVGATIVYRVEVRLQNPAQSPARAGS